MLVTMRRLKVDACQELTLESGEQKGYDGFVAIYNKVFYFIKYVFYTDFITVIL